MNNKDAQKMYELKKKNPTTAVVLSLLITGAGHWYLGKIGKGFAFLISQILLWFLFLGWIMWIAAPIDAYQEAKKQNAILKLELGLKD